MMNKKNVKKLDDQNIDHPSLKEIQASANDLTTDLEVIKLRKQQEHNRIKQRLKTKLEKHKKNLKQESNPNGVKKLYPSFLGKSRYYKLVKIQPIYRYAVSAAVVLLLTIPIYEYFIFPRHLYHSFSLSERAETQMSIKKVNENTPIEITRKTYNKALELKEKGAYRKAIEYFTSIKDRNYLPLALYNTALLQIRIKDYEKAKITLQQLIGLPQAHYLKPKAQLILKYLSKSKLLFLF